MALMTKVGMEFIARNRANNQINSFNRSIKRMGRQMLAIAGVGGGFYAVRKAFDYVTKAAMKQEDALFLLEAALKAAGEYTDETMKGFETFAASIQKATVYGDEEVLALMQLMKSLGVTSSGLEQATKMAIGLAAATGRDVKSMSMYIALAQQGEFTMLRRYIPALRSTTDATEQLRIITEFAARGFKIAEAQAKTASGSFKKMWNAVSDLAEIMGKPFIDKMAKDARRATTNIEILTEALKKHKKAVEDLIKAEGRMKYIPMGVPFYAPQVSKDISDWYEEPSERESLAGQLTDQTWAMKKLSEEYKIQKRLAEETTTMEQHRMKMLEKGGTIQEMEWKRDTERIRLQMEIETETREKAAQKSLEIAQAAAERHKRIAEDIALSMAQSWTNAIDQMMFEGKKFWDAMEDMARSLLRSIINIIMYKKFAEPMAYGIMGLPVPGMVGVGGTPTPFASPLPSVQYGGEVTKTGLILAHKGETFSGVQGGGMGTIEISIHNEGSEKLEISSVEEYMFGDQRIIDVTLQAMQHNMGYQSAIKSATRS